MQIKKESSTQVRTRTSITLAGFTQACCALKSSKNRCFRFHSGDELDWLHQAFIFAICMPKKERTAGRCFSAAFSTLNVRLASV
jgi:hypothetical protein